MYVNVKSLPSKFCRYMYIYINHSKGVEFSVPCVVWVSLLSKLGWKGLMTYLTKKKSLFLHDYWTKSNFQNHFIWSLNMNLTSPYLQERRFKLHPADDCYPGGYPGLHHRSLDPRQTGGVHCQARLLVEATGENEFVWDELSYVESTDCYTRLLVESTGEVQIV